MDSKQQIEQEAQESYDRYVAMRDEVDAGFQLCRDILARAPTLPVIFLTDITAPTRPATAPSRMRSRSAASRFSPLSRSMAVW